jgi:hypothetical protein
MNVATRTIDTFDSDFYFARHRSCETLLRDGFIEIPMPRRFLELHIGHVLAGMRLITEKADLGKLFSWRAFTTDEYGKGYEQEVGLKFKNDDERKWTFQYMSSAYAQGEQLPAELRDFFRSLHDLELQALEITRSIVREFDSRNTAGTARTYAGGLQARMPGATCVTRILRYPKGTHATKRAKTHIDRSLMTSHWFGTHQGLALYSPDGSWKRVDETSYDSMALFPGEKFAAATKNALGTYGTPHGVWCDENLQEDRFAVVSFVHPEAIAADCQWLRANKTDIEAYELSLER